MIHFRRRGTTARIINTPASFASSPGSRTRRARGYFSLTRVSLDGRSRLKLLRHYLTIGHNDRLPVTLFHHLATPLISTAVFPHHQYALKVSLVSRELENFAKKEASDVVRLQISYTVISHTSPYPSPHIQMKISNHANKQINNQCQYLHR